MRASPPMCIVIHRAMSRGEPVRTNVVLNDDLVAEALKLSGLKTKRSVIEAGLRMLVDVKRRRSLLELEGAHLLADDYDYKAARASRA